MPGKTVPLSVRVSPDDAEFLARLRVSGGATPSEKLRALLRHERRRREGNHDYGRVLAVTQEDTSPTLSRILDAENRQQVHSEVIHLVADWLPKLMATFVTGFGEDVEDEEATLSELERRLVDQTFGLAESVLRLAVTKKVRGYDPDVVNDRIEPLLEIVDVVRSTRNSGKES